MGNTASGTAAVRRPAVVVRAPPPPPPPPVNCQVSGWSNSGGCSATACGTTGTQQQTRTVTVQSANGGSACPPLTQNVSCSGPPCPPPPPPPAAPLIKVIAGGGYNSFTVAPNSYAGPDGSTPWIWNQGGKPGAWIAWTSGTSWPTYASQGPAGTQPLLIQSTNGYWALSFLSNTNQLCMWKYGQSGSTWSFTPQWWTSPSTGAGVGTLPTFSSSGVISWPYQNWSWSATSGKAPYSLSVSNSGNIIVTDSTGATVNMTPAWPTSGWYH